jgi:protein disulfide-isomerase A1
VHKQTEKVVIAKFDATENDLPVDAGFDIEGFPTLKLFKAETNEIVDYNGDRTMNGLAEFVQENAVFGREVKEVEESETEEEHDEL